MEDAEVERLMDGVHLQDCPGKDLEPWNSSCNCGAFDKVLLLKILREEPHALKYLSTDSEMRLRALANQARGRQD